MMFLPYSYLIFVENSALAHGSSVAIYPRLPTVKMSFICVLNEFTFLCDFYKEKISSNFEDEEMDLYCLYLSMQPIVQDEHLILPSCAACIIKDVSLAVQLC